eukprot:COSAG04_NODE_697_length_11055_cov_5.640471_8_plen_256_part_00
MWVSLYPISSTSTIYYELVSTASPIATSLLEFVCSSGAPMAILIEGHPIANYNGVYDQSHMEPSKVEWGSEHGRGTRVALKSDGRSGVSTKNRDRDGEIKIKFDDDGSESSYISTSRVWVLAAATDGPGMTQQGFPVLKNAEGKYCYRHASSQKWFLKPVFEPDSSSRNAEIQATAGSLPLGAHSWRCFVDGSDVEVTLTVMDAVEAAEKERLMEEFGAAAVAAQEQSKGVSPPATRRCCACAKSAYGCGRSRAS